MDFVELTYLTKENVSVSFRLKFPAPRPLPPPYRHPHYRHPHYRHPHYRHPHYRHPHYRHPHYRHPHYRHPPLQTPPITDSCSWLLGGAIAPCILRIQAKHISSTALHYRISYLNYVSSTF